VLVEVFPEERLVLEIVLLVLALLDTVEVAFPDSDLL
jgi:hypothetical protein